MRNAPVESLHKGVDLRGREVGYEIEREHLVASRRSALPRQDKTDDKTPLAGLPCLEDDLSGAYDLSCHDHLWSPSNPTRSYHPGPERTQVLAPKDMPDQCQSLPEGHGTVVLTHALRREIVEWLTLYERPI